MALTLTNTATAVLALLLSGTTIVVHAAEVTWFAEALGEVNTLRPRKLSGHMTHTIIVQIVVGGVVTLQKLVPLNASHPIELNVALHMAVNHPTKHCGVSTLQLPRPRVVGLAHFSAPLLAPPTWRL